MRVHVFIMRVAVFIYRTDGKLFAEIVFVSAVGAFGVKFHHVNNAFVRFDNVGDVVIDVRVNIQTLSASLAENLSGKFERIPICENLSAQNILLYKVKRTRDLLSGSFFLVWCGQQDLNLHEPTAHKNLNLARLPIPPCPHYGAILDYRGLYVNSMR